MEMIEYKAVRYKRLVSLFLALHMILRPILPGSRRISLETGSQTTIVMAEVPCELWVSLCIRLT
jgi:hypothetical protein